MAAKATRETAFSVLVDPAQFKPTPVCALVGDEGYLLHEARRALVRQWLGAEDANAQTMDGRAVELRDVLDALAERSLFGAELRLVAVERADKFVSNFRQQLEQYVARPLRDAILILEVDSFPGNTRLAKSVAESGLILNCQTPDSGRELVEFNRQLKDWLVAAAPRDFGCQVARGAADMLLELLPSEPGILYQEVARLALLAHDGGTIEAQLVREHVGGWRTRTTWDMIDAAADGRASAALDQLDRLLVAGEEPHGLLPQMASTLRRFAMAAALVERAERQRQSLTLRAALQQAGVPPFKLGDAERQLRQIGRARARRIYRWLLAADLEIKGYNSSKDRARRVIELLIVRLSRQALAAGAAAR